MREIFGLPKLFNALRRSRRGRTVSDGSTLDDRPSEATPPTEEESFHPSPIDVSKVQSLFLQRLPMEIIDTIIDFAEYWPRLVVSYEGEASAYAMSSDPVSSLVLQSDPVPGLLGSNMGAHPVRKVIFRLLSHDQGWSSEGLGGTYTSYTWFEALLERPLSPSVVLENEPPLQTPLDISSEMKRLVQGTPDASPETSTTFSGREGWHLVPVGGIKRRKVQRNIRASDIPKHHTVVWRYDDNDEFPSEEQTWDSTSAVDGRGVGGEFVRSMKSGDRVLLVSRAVYPGWCNHLQQASIEIYYAVY